MILTLRATPGKFICVPACLVILACFANAALAHGDADKPLYVSPDGVDSGSCDNRQFPCRSISYVLRLAAKGAQIRVAEGTYAIEDTEDLFHVISGMMDVTGGYRRSENFARAGSGFSILTGVPIEFRDLLRGRGFHVIADRKAIDGPRTAKALQLLDLHEQLKSSLPATPCTNGFAAGLACNAIDLVAHMSLQDISAAPASSNDVWGFVDLNSNREYVIVGYNIGTAVIDVTDPERPREVGFVDGQNAGWRDIKVFQEFDTQANRWRAYAYVTTDGASDGLFVIDLSGLPQRIQRAGYASDHFSAHNVYGTGVDFSTGIPLAGTSPTLVIAGSNLGGGRYRSYALGNASAPDFVGGASSANDYMHDAASLLVTDSRKDTQCVNSGSVCEVLLDFNESTLDIWDITIPSTPQRLSRTSYTNSGYTHSGWPSEDGRYVFLHDELDEQRFGLNTTLRVFSIASLSTPSFVGSWSGTTTAIDHNGYVRGNRYYMSNYSRGLTVLDISNPAAPVAIGRLDTYPFSDASGFVGAWGVYPYLHSRIVAISDINSGLYLAADRTLDVPQGRLQFADRSYGASEGSQATLVVQRAGGASGNVSVDYQLIAATASGDDYVTATGTLSWGAADASDRTIDITAVSDGVSEGLERLLVRLQNPAGGATLGGTATASVYIGDAGAASEVAFAESLLTVAERGFATAIVVLQRTGSAVGPASVDFAVSGGDASLPGDFSGAGNGTISWADGDGDPKWLEFSIEDDGINESTEFFELTLSNAVGATVAGPGVVRIDIENGTGLNQAPNAVAGTSQTVSAGAQVTLNGSASNDPNGDVLTFAWAQTGGPQVTLSNANTATARFTAPSVASDTLLQFRLTVRDPAGLTNFATTAVTILAAGNSGGGGGTIDLLLLLGLLALALSRRDGAG